MKRYAVVLALFVLSMITYIDRACISVAKDPIARDLSLSDRAMGMVFSAFALGYAVAQIPAGWFADRFGPRLALSLMVTAWSALTAMTGAARNLASLLAIRFLFGVGEAGAFPGSARAICNWLPVGERGRANGILFSGSRLGAALAFPLLAWMLSQWSWRLAFVLLCLVGVAWSAAWFLWFRDHPAVPVPQDPPSGRPPVALSQVFHSRATGLAMVQYFASNFTFFICLTWMHPYLKRQFALDDAEAARFAMAPLLLGSASQWVAGWLVDRLYHSRWRSWSRRIPGMLGFAMAAGGVLAITGADTPGAASFFFSLAAFGADLTISPSWVYCADIAGKNAGSVSGAMNMIGNLGSFISANAFPFLQSLTGSASSYFVAAAMLNLSGLLCWFCMRSLRQE